jgi:Leucine-rich repeat (LRR) protein
MLKNILGFFSGNDKNEDKENKPAKEEVTKEESAVTPPVPETPPVDYTKYIEQNENYFNIRDYRKEIKELPDNFFDSYLNIEHLHISIGEITSLPSSIGRLVNLKNLDISYGKYRSLPDLSNLKLLEHLTLTRNNLIDLNKELPALKDLPSLKKLSIGGYKGNSIPKSIALFKNLEELEFEHGLKDDKFKLADLCELIAQMPWLKKLKFDMYIRAGIGYKETLPEEFINLDFLDEISIYCYYAENEIPSVLSLFKHANFTYRSHVSETIQNFREQVNDKNLSDLQRRLLFCFFIKNYKEIRNYLPDSISIAHSKNEKTGIILLSKIKGLTQKALNEKLANTSFYIAKPEDKGHVIYITGADTEFETIRNLISEGKTIAIQDYLQDLIIKIEDPWLLQNDNSGLNDQLLQLLSSNQPDNYRLAFEIIEGGGANKTIQALLAAIMLSHPDKKIATAAERLYDKYGSASYKEYCKQNKSSNLRLSGSSDRRVTTLTMHPDVDQFSFRLMHHLIASSNPNIKDVQPGYFKAKASTLETIPELIKFFSNIVSLDFSECPNLKLETAIPWLKQMTGLKELIVSGSHITIPENIGELIQLEIFEAEFNTFANAAALGKLIHLKKLNIEGCKVASFEWLQNLASLQELNINNNNLTSVPTEIINLRNLSSLYLKQNKLSAMEEILLQLPYLRHLDLSNNSIATINYLFFGKLGSLLLRSNKIEEFDCTQIERLGISCSLDHLNLGSNKLKHFSLGKVSFSLLSHLDISNNQISELSSSVFENTRIHELYAGKNQITDIPDSVAKRGHYSRIWLQNNKITELRQSFASIRVDNCDLSNNLIEKMHPDFEIKRERDYSRLYWKIGNNPVSKSLTGAAGLYGR